METKHTPGPWVVGAPPPNGEQTIGTDQGLIVAVATTGAGVPTLANARLIAAAPELLEALIALRERHQIDDPHHADICEFCRMADAAISKALESRSTKAR